jgi:hypothetical protein
VGGMSCQWRRIHSRDEGQDMILDEIVMVNLFPQIFVSDGGVRCQGFPATTPHGAKGSRVIEPDVGARETYFIKWVLLVTGHRSLRVSVRVSEC